MLIALFVSSIALAVLGFFVKEKKYYNLIAGYKSLSEEEKEILTDACKIFSIKGEKVYLIDGEAHNIKITYPFDLRVAKSLLDDEI